VRVPPQPRVAGKAKGAEEAEVIGEAQPGEEGVVKDGTWAREEEDAGRGGGGRTVAIG
jgi:hypothetical protein